MEFEQLLKIIAEMIESEFQISIADDELMKISTVQDAYDAIEKYL